MRQISRMKKFGILFAFATMIYAINTRQTHGRFLGVPFEFRPPTVERMRERWWNPRDERIFTPHVFGIGWSVNLYQLCKLLGIIKNKSQQ